MNDRLSKVIHDYAASYEKMTPNVRGRSVAVDVNTDFDRLGPGVAWNRVWWQYPD